MNQVLDEIGIEVKGKMDSAPTAGSSSLAGKTCYTNSPFKKEILIKHIIHITICRD